MSRRASAHPLWLRFCLSLRFRPPPRLGGAVLSLQALLLLHHLVLLPLLNDIQLALLPRISTRAHTFIPEGIANCVLFTAAAIPSHDLAKDAVVALIMYRPALRCVHRKPRAVNVQSHPAVRSSIRQGSSATTIAAQIAMETATIATQAGTAIERSALPLSVVLTMSLSRLALLRGLALRLERGLAMRLERGLAMYFQLPCFGGGRLSLLRLAVPLLQHGCLFVGLHAREGD
mmetsp:Transcript_19791/g.55896  ORF Transcript_19791/g.55896 Transcript_19791/m.55896 type:complete len:232 (+) Transcript_19791:1253-1948(+)